MSKPYRLAWHKRIMDIKWLRAILTFLLSLIVRFLYYTSRIDWRIDADAAPYINGDHPSIYNFWHSRLLFMSWTASRRRPMHVLVSQHRDGAFIGEAVRWLGIRTIHGSSSKGARAALRTMIESVRAGQSVALTPDGPRGPAQIAAMGPIWIAKKTGAPLIPLSYSSTRRRHFRSWDKFLLPLPFGRVIMRAASPIFVPADADADMMEQKRIELETRLREITAEIDTELDR